MTAAALRDELRRLGVTLTVEDGDKIRFRGPAGALTPALRDEIRQERGGLRALACGRCRVVAVRLVRAYWKEDLCPSCCQVVADDYDRAGTWPSPFGLPDAGSSSATALAVVLRYFPGAEVVPHE